MTQDRNTLIIGSRESVLAVRQSELVLDYLRRNCPQRQFELLTMKTTGDRILERTLDKIGGKGLFVSDLFVVAHSDGGAVAVTGSLHDRGRGSG